ncbi:MAG: radical protein, partial [Anaerocolumna sp.]|nr:radical protein [Anaerocolumna sp.]
RVLEAAKSRSIHTALETNLTLPWKVAEPIAELCDLVMMDIKLWDAQLHRKWTGGDNKNVLRGHYELSDKKKSVIVRTPIVPTVNDNLDEIGAIARFVAGFNNVLYYELLPYHPLGRSKQLKEGAFKPELFEKPDSSRMLCLASEAKSHGIAVRVAGKEI